MNGDFRRSGPRDPADMSDLHGHPGCEIVAERPFPKVVVLRVTGEVDLWTSVPLMESIIAAHAEHPELIAVDLSEVTFLDSAGLRTLEEGARLLEDGRVHFAVISPSSHELAHHPQLAGLHRLLNLHESIEDALGPWREHKSEVAGR